MNLFRKGDIFVRKKVKFKIVVILFLTVFFARVPNLFSSEMKPAGSEADSSVFSTRTTGDSVVQYNQFGSFGLFLNGIRTNIQANKYNLLANYNYRNFNGYRAHSTEYAHTLNLMVETTPSANTKLQITGVYLNGEDKRPGSLTKGEFEQDPFQADPRAVNRDEKRIAVKEQLGINYSALFGRSLNQKIEISGYGRIENFIRSTKEFKIISRYGLGLTASYTNRFQLLHHNNEFSTGANLFTQPERTEEYENFSGQKSDQLEQIKTEKSNSSGCFITDNFDLVNEKLFLQLTGRFDHVIYKISEETLPSRSDKKIYQAVTPQIGLYYKPTRRITLFTSYGWSFTSPEDKELDSFFPVYLYNQDLMAQVSKTIEAGVKGDLVKKDSSALFRKFHFYARLFRTIIDHEIVPYEVFGDEFFRNATKTRRFGLELGSSLEIVHNLVFSVTWTYSHFIYATYAANSLETDSTGNVVEIYRDFSGSTEPNIPRNNLDLSLSYKHPVGRKAGIFAQVSYQHLSGLWVDDANSDKTGSCDLANASVGIDMKFGHFMLSASGGINNIFNRIYVGYTNINSADKRFYNAGAPGNFTGSVNVGYLF